MEIENNNFPIKDLERRTYRYLQQMAKSLSLPSNVKKVYLIQLIYAKKHKSEEEVNSIIQQVKSERRKLAQSRKNNRKRHVQNQEISSTSRLCQSPPITHTPKRLVHPVLRYSPEFSFSYNKCNSKQNLLTSSDIPSSSISSSDRVLRSFNLKALRKSYGNVNVKYPESTAVRVRNRATSPKEKIMGIVNARGKLTKFNIAETCMQQRHQPSIFSRNSCLAVRNDNPKKYIIPHNPRVLLNQVSLPQPKRKRTLSGIYPLASKTTSYQNQIQGVKLRHTDGRLLTINALVQKRTEFKPPTKRNNEITIQDILNSIENNPITTNSLIHTTTGYINEVHKTSVSLEPENYKENDLTDGYYHKKIRSEQVRYRRMSCKESEERLPQIADVFSQFNSVPNRNVTEPLYVQVSVESERFPSYGANFGRNILNTHMLESVYNFKGSFLTNTPLLHIATTTNTKCVYSTPLIVTAKAQQSASLIISQPFNTAPYQPDSQYIRSQAMEMPHLYAQLNSNQDDSCQRLEFNEDIFVPSPVLSQSDMVEDALEIISQDGDYLERIEMDIRVQCVLCSWAGPKIILEFHIRKEHPMQIHQHGERAEWSLEYTLDELALGGGLWQSQVLEYDAALWVLSAQYRDPDSVVVTLCSLSMDPIDKYGTITTYNTETREPYLWEGPIQPLPPNLPYENDLPGLTIKWPKLCLCPNSDNLKSPSTAVIEQPELKNIRVAVFVRLF